MEVLVWCRWQECERRLVPRRRVVDGLVDVVVRVRTGFDVDTEEGEVVVHGDCGGLYAHVGATWGVDEETGEEWRSAGAEGDLDVLVWVSWRWSSWRS